jgi:SNF2 family DNA or RNA helicase
VFPYSETELASTHGYHPNLDDFNELVSTAAGPNILFLGNRFPDIDYQGTEKRQITEPEVELPRGLYWFNGLDGMRVLYVFSDLEPVNSEIVEVSKATDEHPLVAAGNWHAALWRDAEVVKAPKFTTGDQVIFVSNGQDTIIRSRTRLGGTWLYSVIQAGRRVEVAEGELDFLPTDDDPEQWIKSSPADAAEFAATLTRKKLESLFTDTVFSFRATRTIFRPYQFKPIIKLLQTGRSRLLIADEVGLGKTIEAGLIWTELEARKNANRVLIVSPSALVPKWRQEMDSRFNFELIELDGKSLPDFEEKILTGRLPKRGAYIGSLNKLRQWDSLKDFVGLLKFDLVIIDEAHSLRNSSTRSFALGSLLSEMTDNLVFLSATPLNLHNRDLFNLLDLLSPGEFGDTQALELQLQPNRILHETSLSLNIKDLRPHERVETLMKIKDDPFGRALSQRPEFEYLTEILQEQLLTPSHIVEARRYLADLNALSAVLTRTRKIEVDEQKALREPREVQVKWVEVERAFYQEYLAWCTKRAAVAKAPLEFSMQMPLRLASACLPAARDQVLSWSINQADPLDLDSDEVRPSASSQVEPHAELIVAAKRLGETDTKFDTLLDQLQQLKAQGKQVLLFTFSIPTLAYLRQRLSGEFRVAILSGKVSKDERQRIMDKFRNGGYDVVLANRVASEGLDFEFCSVVINYDLPWNPMEVEQRIGRIDRIGQAESKILIINFYNGETIDEKIMIRVLHRIGLFKNAIGEMEPIIHAEWKKLKSEILDFQLTEEQREAKLQQMDIALEAQRDGVEEINQASSFLLSTSDVDVNGMEDELLQNGRYIGNAELEKLVTDWVRIIGDSSVKVAPDGRIMSVRGNAKMAQQVQGLISDGIRNSSEIQEFVDQLRSESEVHFILDQELARVSGGNLLTPNHPAVLAALRVPAHQQSRFSVLEIASSRSEVSAGTYFLQLAVARWGGVRPGVEIWGEAVERSGKAASAAVLDLVLSALASGDLKTGNSALTSDELRSLLDRTNNTLGLRNIQESRRRSSQANALLETRRVNAVNLHERKLQSIDKQINTLRQSGNLSMIPASEGRRRQAQLNHDSLMANLEVIASPGLTVENFAICEVNVLDSHV